MSEGEFKNEFEKQFYDRLRWKRGSLFHFAKETRIMTESDFALVLRVIDEARKELIDKAKTINDCEFFLSCWGKVVPLDDVLKWFGEKKE